jgi:catechol 2,3-dioxygenase-like lactoylglutathione lyase family enzyme
METPRLLAIDDVCLAAPPELAARIADFYTSIVGLRLLDPKPEDPVLVFRGYSPVKPRLRVALADQSEPELRGYVQIHVPSLDPIHELASEHGVESCTTQRLSYYDRRLLLLDPAGNRVELVAYHPF